MSRELKYKIKNLPFLQRYFYDFYLCTHLWWTYGEGKSVYGFESTNILSYDKEQKLNEFCLETFNQTKQKVLIELYYCITREGRHLTFQQGDNYGEYNEKFFCNKTKKGTKFFSPKKPSIAIIPKWKIVNTKNGYYLKYKKMNLTQKQYLNLLLFSIPEFFKYASKLLEGKLISNKEHKNVLNDFNDINNCISNNLEKSLNDFFFNFIENILRGNANAFFGLNNCPYATRESPIEICDHTVLVLHKFFSLYRLWNSFYGGKKWAKACKMWFELYNSKTIKDDIFIIDKIFDLQHNTGIIFSKKGCNFRQLTKTHLDNRSKFCHNKDFLDFVSLKAKKHCLNYSNL
jgi:hypothetical protein